MPWFSHIELSCKCCFPHFKEEWVGVYMLKSESHVCYIIDRRKFKNPDTCAQLIGIPGLPFKRYLCWFLPIQLFMVSFVVIICDCELGLLIRTMEKWVWFSLSNCWHAIVPGYCFKQFQFVHCSSCSCQ